MGARYDISKFTIPLAIAALILLSSFVFVTGDAADALRYSFIGQYFHTDFFLDKQTLSKILSILLLAACPLMFYIMDRHYPLDISIDLPLMYALLIFSCKDALCLSPVHIAAFFLTWAIYFSFRASLATYNVDYPFISMLLLSTASLFFVPLIWLAPLMAALDNNNSAKKLRTVTGSICGLLLPMIIVTGIHIIASGYTSFTEPVMRYLEMTVDIDPGLTQMKISTVLKVLLIIVSAVWATVAFIKTFNTLDIAAERCHMRCMLYSFWLTLIALAFGNSLASVIWIPVLMPLSFFLFAFFNRQTEERNGIFLFAILLLLVVAERIVILL